MTPSELKKKIESPFFSRKTMKFFGDSMKNYGVRETKINEKRVWELYRKNPVKNGIKTSVFFDCDTFKRVRLINRIDELSNEVVNHMEENLCLPTKDIEIIYLNNPVRLSLYIGELEHDNKLVKDMYDQDIIELTKMEKKLTECTGEYHMYLDKDDICPHCGKPLNPNF